MRRFILSLVLMAVATGCAQSQSPPSQAANYTLVWSDNFSTLSLCTTNVDGCKWYYPGLYNFQASGAVTDPYGTYVNLDWTIADNTPTDISTCSTNGAYCHAWTFGYFEFSVAFNPVTGSWPALWLMPVAYNKNRVQTGPELDVLEWKSQTPTLGYGTIEAMSAGTLLGSAPSTPPNYDTYTFQGGTDLTQFNTYGVLWTSSSVSWYFNNVLVETADITVAPFNTQFAGQYPMFIILSQIAGCNNVWYQFTPCSGQVSPIDTKVAWVHVFRDVPSNSTSGTFSIK